MKTLFIDTHLSDVILALYNDNKLYKIEEVKKEKQNSTLIMPMLTKLLEGENYDDIIVVNGPGSFTGVRLGVTIAKTLAYTMNKPIKVISYLEMMNASLGSGSHVVGLSDGNGYFLGEFNKQQKVKDYCYLSNKEFKEYSQKVPVETEVSIDMEKVLNYAKSLSYLNPHAVNPIYVKLIGVEYVNSSN